MLLENKEGRHPRPSAAQPHRRPGIQHKNSRAQRVKFTFTENSIWSRFARLLMLVPRRSMGLAAHSGEDDGILIHSLLA